MPAPQQDVRTESNSKVVPLHPGVMHQPAARPPTKEVAEQRRMIRELSARYRNSTSRPQKEGNQMSDATMSAAQAAAKANVDKSTIARAIQAGKIKASRNDFGDYEITPEALSKYRRRYPQRQQQQPKEIVADIWSLLGEVVDKLTALEATMKGKS
jgi:hypothetical protein